MGKYASFPGKTRDACSPNARLAQPVDRRLQARVRGIKVFLGCRFQY